MILRHVLPISVACALALALGSAGRAGAVPRVIGGSQVNDGDFKVRWGSVVSIARAGVASHRDGHTCTGTYLGGTAVLTARHCVEEGIWRTSASQLIVRGGHPAFGSMPANARVRRITLSPYRSTSWIQGGGDIAILHLDRPLAGVDAATIARPGDEPYWGGESGRATGASIVGWGVTIDGSLAEEREFGPTPARLHAADVPVHPDATCADAAYPWRVNYICLGTAEGEGTRPVVGCFGDSGGPLYASDPAGVGPPRVVGVLSHGYGSVVCRDTPLLATNVAAHAAWIDRAIAGTLAPPPNGRDESVQGTSGSRLVRRIVITDSVLSPGGYAYRLRHARSGESFAVVRFAGRTVTYHPPPTSSPNPTLYGELVAIDADGNESAPRAIAPIGTWSDRAAPARVRRFHAVRRGWRHVLSWAATADRGDRVIGYYIEQRRLNGRWSFEHMELCDRCMFRPRARPGRSSVHIMLPGSRQFRIAAVDRAGNFGPWSYQSTTGA